MRPNPPPRRPLSFLLLAIAVMLVATGLLTTAPTTPAQPVLTADTAGVEPGVVRVDTRLAAQDAVGTGAGIALDGDGVVLTNNHVIRGAAEISVTSVGNGQTYPADVLGYDRKSDIAVLRLRGANGLPVAPTADSGRVRVGDAITAVGFPGGGGLTRSPGEVRALGQNITANDELTGSVEELTDLIGFTGDIQPGDSGGPVVDPSGQVIGITTAGSQNFQMTSGGGGFAVPINRALGIADAIRAGDDAGSVHVGPTGILGVAVSSGSGETRGVPVKGVLRDGPAARAGFSGGELITAIDAVPVPDATVLTDVIDERRPGDTVMVSFDDPAGAPRSVPVTLIEGPPN